MGVAPEARALRATTPTGICFRTALATICGKRLLGLDKSSGRGNGCSCLISRAAEFIRTKSATDSTPLILCQLEIGWLYLVFLPRAVIHCCLSREPRTHTNPLRPVMRIVIWVCKLELSFQELLVLCCVYCLRLFVWWTDIYYDNRRSTATCEYERIAPSN